MKMIYKRIIAFSVSLTVAGVGVGAYFSGKNDPFDPDKYSLNDKLNKNQITFDEDKSNNVSDENGDSNGESTHWEKDNTSDKTIGNNSLPNAPVLFQTKKDQDQQPTLIDPDKNGGDNNNAPDSDNTVSRDDNSDNAITDPNDNTYVVSGDADNADITVRRPDNSGGNGNITYVPSNGNGGNSNSNGQGGANSRGDNAKDDKNNTTNGGNSNSDNNGNGSNNGSGGNNNNKPSTPDDPSTPDKPSEPVYDNNYVEKEPELPNDIYDGMLPTYPMPDEGITPDSGDDMSLTELSVIVLDQTFDTDCIYYGEKLTPWILLCATNVHLSYNGKMYRITDLNSNIKITDYPETATEDFTCKFSARLNADSPWITQEATFSVKECKVIVADFNHNDFVNSKSTQYPEIGGTVDLLDYYQKMYDLNCNLFPTVGQEITTVFPGWSENNGGEPVYYDYEVKNKGLNVLYPLPKTKLTAGFKAVITTMWDSHDNYVYLQTITDYTGKNRDISIPQGIHRVDMSADVDSIEIPASVMYVNNQLLVKKEYKVSEKSSYFSSVNGMLFNKDITKLIDVPYEKTYVSVPATVKTVDLDSENSIENISFTSTDVPDVDLSKLHGADIYVPDSCYLKYLKKWALRLGDNTLKPQSENTHTNYYTKDDAILIDTDDGTALCGVTENVKGVYVVPEGVTEIRTGAFENSELTKVILPTTLKRMDERVLALSESMDLYFCGENVPTINPKSIMHSRSIVRLHVKEGCKDAYETMLSKFTDQLEFMVVEDDFEVCHSNDYEYFKENGGITLLKAPADLKYFYGELPDGTKPTAIANRAFSRCKNLVAVQLSDETKEILTGAFDGCDNLEKLVCLSKEYIFVSDGVLDNCTKLACVAFNAAEGEFENEYDPKTMLKSCQFYCPDGASGYANTISQYVDDYDLYVDDNGVGAVYGYDQYGYIYLLSVTSDLSGEYTFKEDTDLVAPYAFASCKNEFTIDPVSWNYLGYVDQFGFAESGLSGDITIHKNTLLIGDHAFLKCANITSVTFDSPDTYNLVLEQAFAYCPSLKTVTFNEDTNVTAVMSGAFIGTSIEHIVLPPTLTSLYYGVFGECPYLKTIEFTSQTPPELVLFSDGSTFQFATNGDTINDVQIIVPEGCAETYYNSWIYRYIGYASLEDWCSNVYLSSLWDSTTLEECTQQVVNKYAQEHNGLRKLLGLEETESELDYDTVYAIMKGLEEWFIW